MAKRTAVSLLLFWDVVEVSSWLNSSLCTHFFLQGRVEEASPNFFLRISFFYPSYRPFFSFLDRSAYSGSFFQAFGDVWFSPHFFSTLWVYGRIWMNPYLLPLGGSRSSFFFRVTRFPGLSFAKPLV